MKNLSVSLVIMLVLLSCNKSTNCEQWNYYDECEAKTSVICPVPVAYRKGVICGDELRDARTGRVRTILDNAEFRKTRHYIGKVSP